MSHVIGEKDYRLGALERLSDSFALLRQERFAGSIYLGGRAAEAMLRAVIWKNDKEIRSGRKSLETGHDLRSLFKRIEDLGVLTEPERAAITPNIERVGRLWFNNMRFHSTEKIKTFWWRENEINKRRTLKQAAWDYFASCSSVVKQCEVLCKS
ncbi:MAG TPA: hypothetical protein VKX17_23610 [Planctomycetota bacterium]|nr:hypothetical protein [Planctomycetota bacterium]